MCLDHKAKKKKEKRDKLTESQRFYFDIYLSFHIQFLIKTASVTIGGIGPLILYSICNQ